MWQGSRIVISFARGKRGDRGFALVGTIESHRRFGEKEREELKEVGKDL
jgi:hypothetical protein